jgi:hypothetical protein
MSATVTEHANPAEITAAKIELAITLTAVRRLQMQTSPVDRAPDGHGTFTVIRDGRKYRVTVEDLGADDE